MKSEPHRARFSSQEKAILGLLLGVSLLIWAVLGLVLILTSDRPSAAHVGTPVLSPHTLTPTVLSTPLPTLTAFPLASATATQPPPTATPIPAPRPARLLAPPTLVGQETTVIALLGIDESREAGIWRTDSILLIFIHARNKKVGVLSIPRDLWVSIPGHGYGRINTVDSLGERTRYPGGGAALLDQTFRQTLNVPIDHYVRIDFRGFARLIDEVGGVTVDVQAPINDRFPDPLSPSGFIQLTLPAGSQQMDGHMALNYCRSRMTTNDFDRSRRQQQVMMALWKKALTPKTLIRAPKLWDKFEDSFDTDLTMLEAVRLAYTLQNIGQENVRTRHLDFTTATPWSTPGGSEVLLPQKDAIQRIILELLSPSE
jgi:LCP family protein required for cell wall assembly